MALSAQTKALNILYDEAGAFSDVIKSMQVQAKPLYCTIFHQLNDLHALELVCYWYTKQTLTDEKLAAVIARNPSKFISGLILRASTDINALRLLLTGKTLLQTDIPPCVAALTQKPYTEHALGRLSDAASTHMQLSIDLTEAFNAIENQVKLSRRVNRLYEYLSRRDASSVEVHSRTLKGMLGDALSRALTEVTDHAVTRRNDNGVSGLLLAVSQGKFNEQALLKLLSHTSSQALTKASAPAKTPNAASVLHVLASAPDRASVLDEFLQKCEPSGLAEAALHVSKTIESNKSGEQVREITGNAFEMAFQRQSCGAYFTLVHRALGTENQDHVSKIDQHLSSQAEYRAEFAKGLYEVARAKPTAQEGLIYFNQVCEAPHVSTILSGERQTLAQYREALTRAVEAHARSKVAQPGLFTFVFGAAPVAQPPAAAGKSYTNPAPATSAAEAGGEASTPKTKKS